MAKPGRPPNGEQVLPVGRMDRILKEIAALPQQTMRDKEYVQARAQEWDSLFAQDRTVDEIVDAMLQRYPKLGRPRCAAMVKAAYLAYQGTVGERTDLPASATTLVDEYDNFEDRKPPAV